MNSSPRACAKEFLFCYDCYDLARLGSASNPQQFVIVNGFDAQAMIG
jgi:hypothetical protein